MKKSVLSLLLLVLCFGFVRGQDNEYIPPVDTALISYSPNGQYIAIGLNKAVEIVEVASNEAIQTFNLETDIWAAPIWSPDGQIIAFGNRTNLELWTDLSSSPRQVALYEGEVRGFGAIKANAWSSDGRIIAFTTGDAVDLWDTESNHFLIRYNPDGTPWSLAWKHDSNRLLIGGSLFLEIYNAQAQISEKRFSLEPFLDSEGNYVNPAALSIVWSPLEDAFAFASETNIDLVYLSEFANQQGGIIYSDSPFFNGHESDVYSIAWHPSGLYLASSGQDSIIRIWDAVKGEEIYKIELPENTFIRSVAWSPDGSQLVYGSPDGEAELVFVDSAEFLPREE
jgi:WD40 repeat protein